MTAALEEVKWTSRVSRVM